MNYSADTGIGSGPQASHDHDGEFSIECNACVTAWVDARALELVKSGSPKDGARLNMLEALGEAADELFSAYED